MKAKKLGLALFLLALWLYEALTVANLARVNMVDALDKFANFFRSTTFTIAFTLLIVLLVARLSDRAEQNASPRGFAIAWFSAFLFFLVACAALVLHVNPHARFSRDVYPPITPNARGVKTDDYAQLPSHPDIVVLGSSRAFTISPDYIQKVTGYETFNMAVEGARAGDYSLQLNYLLQSGDAPRLLLIEVTFQTFTGDVWMAPLQPISLIPYMPRDIAATTAESVLQDTFNLQTISDSLFIVRFLSTDKQSLAWEFDERGMGIYRPVVDETMPAQEDLARWSGSLTCNRLASPARAEFENMIKMAGENGIEIVLYQSPVRLALYRYAVRKTPAEVADCRETLNRYFSSLTKKNDNVSFVNLSDYERVSNMDGAGFYDAVHARPNAAELIVDALAPTIQSALGK
ncbi:MAG: hypothetical protein HY867_10130 [Chloroflexi bacterium]|nr:hypothetical protein [Chloroflexota bacterium]